MIAYHDDLAVVFNSIRVEAVVMHGQTGQHGRRIGYKLSRGEEHVAYETTYLNHDNDFAGETIAWAFSSRKVTI